MRVLICLIASIIYWTAIGAIADEIHRDIHKIDRARGMTFITAIVSLTALLYFHI